MIGILGTVLVQSSSTFSSIIVAAIGGGLSINQAVPMLMGANIGTSVTNTLVAMTQIGNPEEFERAFACATVHDMFNWCAVSILFTFEVFNMDLDLLMYQNKFGGKYYTSFFSVYLKLNSLNMLLDIWQRRLLEMAMTQIRKPKCMV